MRRARDLDLLADQWHYFPQIEHSPMGDAMFKRIPQSIDGFVDCCSLVGGTSLVCTTYLRCWGGCHLTRPRLLHLEYSTEGIGDCLRDSLLLLFGLFRIDRLVELVSRNALVNKLFDEGLVAVVYSLAVSFR